MADHTYEVDHENGAPMDYPEHQRTYEMFLKITKWGIIMNVALLAALAIGFFAGGGFIGGLLSFVLLMVGAAVFA